MSKLPDRIYIDEKHRESYTTILDNEDFFKQKKRKDQFIFAMAIGFYNKVKRPIKGKKEGLFLIKDLSSEDETLINAIAIYDTNSISILSNKEEVYKIAEEYANAGIEILIGKIKSISFGSFEKEYEKEIYEIYNNINIGVNK